MTSRLPHKPTSHWGVREMSYVDENGVCLEKSRKLDPLEPRGLFARRRPRYNHNDEASFEADKQAIRVPYVEEAGVCDNQRMEWVA